MGGLLSYLLLYLLYYLKERTNILVEGTTKYLDTVTFKVGRQLARVVEARLRVLGPLHVHVEAGLFYVWLSLKFASVQQEKGTLEARLQELIWEVEHLQEERDRQADSDAPLTQEADTAATSNLDAVSPVNAAALPEGSFAQQYRPTSAYSGAVLTQEADTAATSNLDAVSPVNAAALPEGSSAQQYRPTPVYSGAVLTQEADTATASNLGQDSGEEFEALMSEAHSLLDADSPATSVDLPEDPFSQDWTPAANPYEVLLGVLLHMLMAGGQAAIKNMLALYRPPLQGCTDLITEALRAGQVELAMVIGEYCLCTAAPGSNVWEAVLHTIDNLYPFGSPEFITMAEYALHFQAFHMAVLLLAPTLAAMPELPHDGGPIATRLETYLDEEGTLTTCRDLLLACAAKVGQVSVSAAMMAASLATGSFHETAYMLLKLLKRGMLNGETFDVIISSLVRGVTAYDALPSLVEAFVPLGGADTALRVLAVVTSVDSGAADAIYRHLSSDFALTAKLFLDCAHFSGRILACLFDRISEAASESSLLCLVCSIIHDAKADVLALLLRKVLGPFFATVLEELLSTVALPTPITLANTEFLCTIKAKVLEAKLVAEAEVQDV